MRRINRCLVIVLVIRACCSGDFDRFASAAGVATLSVLSVQPRYAAAQQVTEAVKMAASEATENWTNTQLEVRAVELPTFHSRESTPDLFFAALAETKPVAVLGLPSAPALEFFAAVAGKLSIPVISTSVAARKTWNEVYFPSLLYASPSNDNLPWMVKDLLQHFSWSTVCVVVSSGFSAFQAMEDFTVSVAPTYDISVLERIAVEFTSNGNLTYSSELALSEMHRDCKIFLIGLNAPEYLPVMRSTFVNNIATPGLGTAWIFLDMLVAPMLLPNSKEVMQYMDGALLIRPRVDEERLLSFSDKLKRFNSSVYACAEPKLSCVNLEAAYAYDATQQLAKVIDSWSVRSHSEGHRAVSVPICQNVSLLSLPNGDDLVQDLRRPSWHGLLGHSSLNGKNPSLAYDVYNLRPNDLVRVGTWSTNDDLSRLEDIIWTGRSNEVPQSNLNVSSTLNILVPLSAPFTVHLKDPPTRNEHFAGVAVDIVRDVARQVGFNYTFHHWDRTWDEMIKRAGDTDNEYDMAIGSITVKGYRTQFCDFTSSVFQTGLRMLMLRPAEKEIGAFDVLNAFHWSVWLALLCTMLFSAAVMLVLDPESVDTERTGHPYLDALFFTSNVFFFVHEADAVNRKWARGFLLVLQFVMLTLLAAYTANMASFLFIDKIDDPITYTDIRRHFVASRGGTTNWRYARNQLGLSKLVDVSGAEDAVQALRSKRATAYLADSPHIEQIAALHCDLVVVANQVSVS